MNPSSVWRVVDSAQMRALDAHTIESLGVPGELLMESAGRAIVERVLAIRGDDQRAVVIFCATGNNGGDGFVVARQLHELGVPVHVVLLGERASVKGDALSNLLRVEALGLDFCEIDRGESGPALDAVIVIDALFGTGLSRPLADGAADCVDRISAARKRGAYVISADVPSGICADTGAVLGHAVRADETVSMGLAKIGLCQEPGRSHAGRIFVARIGIADRTPDCEPDVELWSPLFAKDRLPSRTAFAHKGSFGHVLVVAGSEGKTGAAHLAAIGAQRAGAGLVTIACPASLNPVLEIKTTEAMTAPVAETQDHGLAARASKRILELAGERDVVALGPGIGQSKETWQLVRELALAIDKPLVLDADALNAFADEPGSLARLWERSAATILTPHPGEAGRLLECPAAEINADRLTRARELARVSGAIVLLKGAGSVVADPSGRVIINPTGGPALAAGGTGDVLTGVLAAYLAQGVAPLEAAGLAAYVHGLAGDLLAREIGESGILASEVAAAVPRAHQALRQGPGSREDHRAEFGPPLLLPFPGV